MLCSRPSGHLSCSDADTNITIFRAADMQMKIHVVWAGIFAEESLIPTLERLELKSANAWSLRVGRTGWTCAERSSCQSAPKPRGDVSLRSGTVPGSYLSTAHDSIIFIFVLWKCLQEKPKGTEKPGVGSKPQKLSSLDYTWNKLSTWNRFFGEISLQFKRFCNESKKSNANVPLLFSKCYKNSSIKHSLLSWDFLLPLSL